MALVIKDRVLETCSSPGSGAVTLLGAVTGYQTFNAAVGNGNTCYYSIADQSGNNWEVGIATFTAPDSLARTTILASSNGGSVVNFSTGTQNVFLTYPADKAVTTDTLAYPPAIGGTTPNAGSFTVLTATQDSAFTSTGALQISKGTSLEQPGSPATGMLRYNTTTNQFEGYSGASPGWNSLGGLTIADDTTSVSTYYPLFYTASSGTATAAFVSSTKFTFRPSTGLFFATIVNGGSVITNTGVQVGNSGTATNNFTWYQPASPDGTVRLGVGNVGSTTSDRITVSGTTTTIAGTTSVSTLDVTSVLDLPVWTTGTRPGSPSSGMTGFNSTIGQSETYSGSTWIPLGGLTLASVQSSNFNALAGFAYPVNVSSAAVVATLPASPVAGNIVNIFDYASSAGGANKIYVSPGSGRINGATGSKLITTTGGSATFVYVDASVGWFLRAFGSSSDLGTPSISYLIAAGGAGGGSNRGGGGGAGGFLTGTTTLSVGAVYSFTVGGGGSSASNARGGSGSNSTGFSLTAIGGGGGGNAGTTAGISGGSGGGTGNSSGAVPGSGTAGQGNRGGYSSGGTNTGGGGGAGAVGNGGGAGDGGSGGAGSYSSVTGSSLPYCGGGGGCGDFSAAGGGVGGGGSGSIGGTGGSGTANTGGGGGGTYNATTSGAGGSGVVILSIPTAIYTGITTGSPTVTTSGANTIVRYTSSGSYTA